MHKGSPWCLWGVSLWKYDQKVWDSFSHFIKFEVADDGYDIKFWTDVWCGDSTLKFSFPELYCIAWNQDAFVADLLQSRNGLICWELNFNQAIQDWELECLYVFGSIVFHKGGGGWIR